MYTVLRLVLKQKCGLEFERKYSAFPEDYMYVYLHVVHGTKCCVHNALYSGLELEWVDIQPTL
jgi:hypothetical protein